MAVISQYLHKVMDTALLQETIRKSIVTLDPYMHLFDSIAFTGLSGTLIAPLLAIQTNKKLLAVRKENSHSTLIVEGDWHAKRYIIVDDLISKGDTIKRINAKIIEGHCQLKDEGYGSDCISSNPPVWVGLLLYQGYNYHMNYLRDGTCGYYNEEDFFYVGLNT